MDTVTFEKFKPIIDRFLADGGWFGPELVLILIIALLLMIDLLLPRQKSVNLVMLAFLGVLLTFGIVIYDMLRLSEPVNNMGGSAYQFPYIFQGMLFLDHFGYFFKILLLIGTGGVIIMTYKDKSFQNHTMGEYYSLLLSSVLGMFLMVSASDLLMLYLAIELTSIPTYLLVTYHREDPKGSEASLKYLVYGAVSTGMMIYGFSWLYGLTGSSKIADISLQAFQVSEGTGGQFSAGLVFFLIFAGIAYKISTVPMQFWTPDVYEGAPTPITTFLAVTSKAAGVGVLIRFMDAIQLQGLGEYVVGKESVNLLTNLKQSGYSGYVLGLALVSALTMTLGNFMALHQKNVKRLLAYSSIAHAGYLLMGICVLNTQGQTATLFYLVAYLIMNLGAFYIVMMVANATQDEELTGFVGLGKASPFYAACMTVFLFSLVGIPPTIGFSGKFQLFAATLSYQSMALWWLVLIAGFNTAVSLYYYARIIKAMYLEDGEHPGVACSYLNAFMVGLLTLSTILLGVCFNWLINSAMKATF